jgi:hypothetical protein
MKFTAKTLLLLAFVPLTFSCASIVSKSNWPFYVESDPAGATVTIENRKGREVFKGKTPTIVHLKSGSGFFAKESYVIRYSRPGYEDKTVNVECKLNGWYFGNILFGGAIGLLIVDPATGAMYKLNGKGTSQTLTPTQQATTHTRSLKIMDIATIPADWHERLVALK